MKLDLASPHTTYRTADGKRVPGVTTVLGNLDKAALIPWAAGLEREHVLGHAIRLHGSETFEADLRIAIGPDLAHEGAKERAADLGTITHARIEAWLRDDELEPDGLPPDLLAESVHGFERFREWWFQEGLTVVETETPMVSERMRCGGTLDVVARDLDGRLVLVDIKTSNATRSWPYPSVIGQVAAYAAIWEEVRGEPIDRVAVARVGKLAGDAGDRLVLSPARRAQGLALFECALPLHQALLALNRKEPHAVVEQVA